MVVHPLQKITSYATEKYHQSVISLLTVAANHPKISTSVVKFGINDVTVLLRWTPQKGATYNFSIQAAEPNVATINHFTKLSSAQITVLYNTHYNVCVEATLCGQKSVSTVSEIRYGEFFYSQNCY